ncbi:hypothetical protein R1flu_010418 [Riccia fluitans]|uniref:Transposase n=1 Tax=Riccia fluitans TaxID=41844 RepID=A0ABD1Z4X2_9MARC
MALEQALTTLKQKGLTIEEVVHDDNTSVDAILTQHGILSSKDLWHKCKNIMSKFKEVLQERRTPSDCSVEAATTIAQVAVFSIQQLKDFCKENGLPAHDIAYKLKSWIYTCAKNAAARGDTTPKMLTIDVQNVADHWAGNHDTCQTLPGVRKCVVENWPLGRDCKYPEGGETHKAVKDFLKKYLTENKMKFYLRARENFISETFHLVINKYATKRIHFDASHTTRLACATLNWNENICREVRVVYNRVSNDIAVRRRARTNRDLMARTAIWKAQLKSRVFA